MTPTMEAHRKIQFAYKALDLTHLDTVAINGEWFVVRPGTEHSGDAGKWLVEQAYPNQETMQVRRIGSIKGYASRKEAFDALYLYALV